MKLLICLVFISLSACTKSPRVYTSPDIPGVECHRLMRRNCGVNLWKCSDHNEYDCVKTVRIVNQ